MEIHFDIKYAQSYVLFSYSKQKKHNEIKHVMILEYMETQNKSYSFELTKKNNSF